MIGDGEGPREVREARHRNAEVGLWVVAPVGEVYGEDDEQAHRAAAAGRQPARRCADPWFGPDRDFEPDAHVAGEAWIVRAQ